MVDAAENSQESLSFYRSEFASINEALAGKGLPAHDEP